MKQAQKRKPPTLHERAAEYGIRTEKQFTMAGTSDRVWLRSGMIHGYLAGWKAAQRAARKAKAKP